MRECITKRVQHEKNAAGKRCNIKSVRHRKSSNGKAEKAAVKNGIMKRVNQETGQK